MLRHLPGAIWVQARGEESQGWCQVTFGKPFFLSGLTLPVCAMGTGPSQVPF